MSQDEKRVRGTCFVLPLPHQPTAQTAPPRTGGQKLPPCLWGASSAEVKNTLRAISSGPPSPAPPLGPDPFLLLDAALGPHRRDCFRPEDGHGQRAPAQEVSWSTLKERGFSPHGQCARGQRAVEAKRRTQLKLSPPQESRPRAAMIQGSPLGPGTPHTLNSWSAFPGWGCWEGLGSEC